MGIINSLFGSKKAEFSREVMQQAYKNLTASGWQQPSATAMYNECVRISGEHVNTRQDKKCSNMGTAGR